MKLYQANKLVQWAINKEYALKPVLKHKDWIAWSKHLAWKPIGSAAVAASQMYKAFPVTMSNAESLIRTLSFVIGAQIAWKSGSPGLRNDIHWSEYKDEDAIDKIMQIGIEMQYEMNFGMSIQDVSQYQFGPAMILGKFKYWNQQNAEDEIEIMKQAFMYFEDLNLETDNFKKIQHKGVGQAIKKFMKLIGYTLKPSGFKVDRLARQELAAFKYLMTVGALTSFLYQTFLWNPLSLRHLPKAAQNSVKAFKAFGWKSGMMHQLRSFAITDVMKMMTFPLAMIARSHMLGGDDADDLEEKDEFFRHWLGMVPWAGYGITFGYDFVIMVISKMMDEEDLFVESAEKTISVKYGRPQIDPFGAVGNLVRSIGERASQALWDATDD